MVVEVIQLMLAPGIMISACGLLILGMNNKYSIVVNRIRLLNEERRRMIIKSGGKEFSYDDNIRFESISQQISRLAYRVKLVRNAVVSYTFAVALFVLSSILIGVNFQMAHPQFDSLIIVLFLAGMLSVLAGVTSAAYEAIKGYEIILLEIKIDE
jgi:hypothetical protein